MDFSNSVIIPRDDFVELEAAAYSTESKTLKDRTIDTVQASVLIVVAGAVVAGASWAWVRATNWYDKKSAERWKNNSGPHSTK